MQNLLSGTLIGSSPNSGFGLVGVSWRLLVSCQNFVKNHCCESGQYLEFLRSTIPTQRRTFKGCLNLPLILGKKCDLDTNKAGTAAVPSPLFPLAGGMEWVLQLHWNPASSGMNACLWSSPTCTEMPGAACFSWFIFPSKHSGLLGFLWYLKLHCENLLGFSNKPAIKGKGSCCWSLW